MSRTTTVAKADALPIEANYAHLRALIAAAESRWQSGDIDEAAALASASARFAWFNHAGVFSDVALERLLVELSRRVPDDGPSSRSTLDGRDRVVLHIATELYPTGGHTQMLSTWISGDRASRHRVVVTRQGWQPIPDKVTVQLDDRTVCLDWRQRGYLQRAAALRRHCREADIVVVHAHPDDILPVLALAAIDKPCIVVNHASHVFWAGASIARTTLHLRRSAEDLAVARRGLPSGGGFVVNRPLVFPDRDVQKSDARRHFGLEDDQIVIATAASASKYEPLDDGDSLIELLVGLAEAHPRLVVLAAGPALRGQWLSAHDATDGRVRALGPLRGVGRLLAAADIYVDSFPFASITSLLEAGAHGLPLVSYRGHGPGCEVLGADPPAIEDDIIYPTTPDEFHQAVTDLVASADLRLALGVSIREKIAATHSSAAWRDAVASLYAFAQRPGAAEAASAIGDVPRGAGALDSTVRCIQQRTGQSIGVDAAHRTAMASMPLRARMRTWRRLRRSGHTVRAREMLRDVDRIRLQKAGYRILRRIRPRSVAARLE